MLIYADEFRVREMMANTPEALKQRQFDDLEDSLRKDFGVRTIASEPGVIQVDINGAHSPAAVIEFLNSFPTACVSKLATCTRSWGETSPASELRRR